MAEADANLAAPDASRKLSDVIRDVKNDAADRDDVVVEMREASRMRLELLAQELQPFFEEVPSDNDWFDFAVSTGAQPRLWIDAVSHVGLGRDRRTYRFVNDSRVGRTVLAESTDLKVVAEQVRRYVAERIIERQRAMSGSAEALLPRIDTYVASGREAKGGWGEFFRSLMLFVIGALVGFAIAIAWFWDRLPDLGIRL